MLSKVCVRLSMCTYTNLEYLNKMSLLNLSEIIEEVEAVNKK